MGQALVVTFHSISSQKLKSLHEDGRYQIIRPARDLNISLLALSHAALNFGPSPAHYVSVPVSLYSRCSIISRYYSKDIIERAKIKSWSYSRYYSKDKANQEVL